MRLQTPKALALLGTIQHQAANEVNVQEQAKNVRKLEKMNRRLAADTKKAAKKERRIEALQVEISKNDESATPGYYGIPPNQKGSRHSSADLLHSKHIAPKLHAKDPGLFPQPGPFFQTNSQLMGWTPEPRTWKLTPTPAQYDPLDYFLLDYSLVLAEAFDKLRSQGATYADMMDALAAIKAGVRDDYPLLDSIRKQAPKTQHALEVFADSMRRLSNTLPYAIDKAISPANNGDVTKGAAEGDIHWGPGFTAAGHVSPTSDIGTSPTSNLQDFASSMSVSHAVDSSSVSSKAQPSVKEAMLSEPEAEVTMTPVEQKIVDIDAVTEGVSQPVIAVSPGPSPTTSMAAALQAAETAVASGKKPKKS